MPDPRFPFPHSPLAPWLQRGALFTVIGDGSNHDQQVLLHHALDHVRRLYMVSTQFAQA